MKSAPVLKKALSRICELNHSESSIRLAMIRIPAAVFLFLDSNYGFIFPSFAFLSWIEVAAATLLLADGLYSIILRLHLLFMNQDPVPLTAAQMRLLGVDLDSPGFQLFPPKFSSPKSSSPKCSNSPFSCTIEGSFILHQSIDKFEPSSFNNTNNNLSFNQSLNSSSWIFQPSTQKAQQEDSSNQTPRHDFKSSYFNSTVESVTDEKSLTEYLKDFETWEKNNSSLALSNADLKSPNSSGNISFWKHSATAGPGNVNNGNNSLDYSPILRKYTYQLSTQMPGSPNPNSSTTENNERSNSPSLRNIGSCNLYNNKEAVLSVQLGVDPLDVVQMTQNLRMWISQTVLVRLVKEIDSTNKALTRLGLSDSKIGEVGLEKVKKNSQLHLNNIPGLAALIPFLEVSTNQEYLVSRLRELSNGGAMGSYRWNAGGSYKGAEWTDKLITDSEIIMHCLACYFDSRLPPNYEAECDGRAFSSMYYYKSPDKPDLKKHKQFAVIIQSSLKPPYFYLQIGDKIAQVSSGCNNLFHTILLFLHHIKTKENGMVGRINFGVSGVNILWVLD